MTVDEVMEQVMFDEAYYAQSGGGVTLSGGEPVLQAQFCLELLQALKNRGIHTVIQTAGNYPYEKLKILLPYIDLVMYDIKAYSEYIYSNYIHGDRDTILENLMKLDKEDIPIIVRTPVIGSVNDTPDEISLIVRFLQNMKNLKQYVLLPYHGLGKAKYDSLGKPYENDFYKPDSEAMKEFERIASEYLPLGK